jgi:CRP-like cAMP-binding protein
MILPATQKIEQYFTKYPKRSYPKGQILVFADENPEYIFYIVKGRVREYAISYRGDEVIVTIYRPPAFFPMSWAINRARNNYFYKTETLTELHIVPVGDALGFVNDNPDVLIELISRVYKSMDRLFGRMVHLMSGSARDRLLYELILECKQSVKTNKEGAYRLDISEVDLAARSGLSRETINREIHKLKAEQMITVTAVSIVVKDLALLEKKLK